MVRDYGKKVMLEVKLGAQVLITYYDFILQLKQTTTSETNTLAKETKQHGNVSEWEEDGTLAQGQGEGKRGKL